MSSSPAVEQSPPPTTPSSPSQRAAAQLDYLQQYTSTPNYLGRRPNPPLNVILPTVGPSTPSIPSCEPTPTPPPRSPGAACAAGDSRTHPVPDGTSSDKSSETAVGGVVRTPSSVLSRKESYKAQRQHYRREKKRAASAILHSIEDPAAVVLADWLKVRGSLKSWTKLWCVLKPGLLLLYKSSKAKSSHWVGTVLLTSCQVIERPSKKDGFCFKLYHPLEQSIWAPRGPHNETIGAVVQPLPTAHLIFRAPSQAAGHCWLDGLELALRCSNAMLRCSRSRGSAGSAGESGAPGDAGGGAQPTAQLSHEELEMHFNEHGYKLGRLTGQSSPLMSTSDYSGTRSRDSSDEKRSSDRQTFASKEKVSIPKWTHLFDCSTDRKDDASATYCSKSLSASPANLKLPKRMLFLDSPLKKKEGAASPTSIFEERLLKFVTSSFPKRRSSTPSAKTIEPSPLRALPGVDAPKSDSDNDEVFLKPPDVSRIIVTAPSSEGIRNYTSSSSGSEDGGLRGNAVKFSLIDGDRLPSRSFEVSNTERREERISSQRVYVAGRIVARELAGAGSDSDTDSAGGGGAGAEAPSAAGPSVCAGGSETERRKREAIAKLDQLYVDDAVDDIGVSGELVEEVTEENKSLLWFLVKQVRPGMDLSKVVLPTFILEPRSFLDKLSDNYYHADLLASASQCDDPYSRFKGVLRWYLSGMYKKPRGLKKPYNPVLGEIFRCRWRHPNSHTYTYYIAEQVSHHPPVSAFYITNRQEGFVIQGSLLARSKFYGNSTSAILEGCARVYLLRWGETYITTAPYAQCKGIVIGTLSMELGGKVVVLCPDTGYSAEIEFKLKSFLGGSDQTNAVSGKIKKSGATIATLDGNWDGRIDIREKQTGEEVNLIDVASLKEARLKRSLVRLSKQHEIESQRLWSKVSEAIANDDQITATEEKTVIEEAQRERSRKMTGPWIPKYFHKNGAPPPPEGVVDQGWLYNHANIRVWEPEDILEYEDSFVIRTLRASPGGSVGVAVAGAPGALPSSGPAAAAQQLSPLTGVLASGGSRQSQPVSDSDSRDGLARRAKISTRTLKLMLANIDTTLKDQTEAIDKLTKTVNVMSERQRQTAYGRRAPSPQRGGNWKLIMAGFILALVFQAFINWLFVPKIVYRDVGGNSPEFQMGATPPPEKVEL